MSSTIEDGPGPRLVQQAPFVLLLGVLASIALFVGVGLQDRVPAGDLTRDLAATTESAWYLGSVSSVGAFGWVVAGAGAGLVVLVLTATNRHQEHRRSFAVLTGLSFWLALDDVLLLHEEPLRRLVGSELPIYLAYAVIGAWWLLRHGRSVPDALLPVLAVALTAMGGSVVIDMVWRSDADLRLLTEDGLKFIGIWSWALFVFGYGVDVLTRVSDH